ncbi:MAG TPA: tRNA threonylcarbamoyladenosine dehydratase [Clostridiales bacterium UBA8960]|nr:tRNA threonylcarbamoyladenosine dehydratase [Clostridiales bacterium UBA8960]
MLNQFSRTELLIGDHGISNLKKSTVAIFGVGGVGSYAVEALARSGVGTFYLYDDDKVCLTNINRQLIATRKTVGRVKVEVMMERILEINPDATVYANRCFFGAETANEIDFTKFDYVIDAIDTVSSKLLLVEIAYKTGIPIISSMGAGNKLDPTRFEVSDINKTSVCPLAKVVRKELKARGIPKLKVVYSKEPAMKPIEKDELSCKSNCICPKDVQRNCSTRRQVPGSIAFVPSVVGLIIAGEVIKDLIK